MARREQRTGRRHRGTGRVSGDRTQRAELEGEATPKKDFDVAYKRTKDVKRPEGMSDEDYAAKQEKYKTNRAKRSKRLLKSTYGKNWGKRVYEGKAMSAKYRQGQVKKLGNLKSRLESVRTDYRESKASTDPEVTAKTEALKKRLDAVKAKKQETGKSVQEFRGQRREALKSAYENPAKAQKAYPKIRGFSGSAKVGRGKGGKAQHIAGSLTQATQGRGPLQLPGGRPNVVNRKRRRRTFTGTGNS